MIMSDHDGSLDIQTIVWMITTDIICSSSVACAQVQRPMLCESVRGIDLIFMIDLTFIIDLAA